MKWFRDFWNWLRQESKIKELDALLNMCSKENELWKKEASKLRNQIDWDKEYTKPKWLDTSTTYYYPTSKIVTDKGEVNNVSIDQKNFYHTCDEIKGVVERNKWKALFLEDKEKCLLEIWKYVIQVARYELDKGEDWRESYITINRRKGDCEDTTILFVCLCREVGLRADEVFNACGWFKKGSVKFGHSYPIVKINDEWYVYETTLESIPKPFKPRLFKGSPYYADWGVCNDLIGGKIIGGKQI